MFYITQCSPLSRSGPRRFAMSRDYGDMEKIFRVRPLPDSFHIQRVRYPGIAFVSPDGPAAINYFATVSALDYPRLIANIADEKTLFDYQYGRMSAVNTFNRGLAEAVLMYKYPPSSLKELPDMFDVQTTTTAGYVRNTYIVADTRSSKTVELYITTKFPYDN